jgi:hypothetical protein
LPSWWKYMRQQDEKSVGAMINQSHPKKRCGTRHVQIWRLDIAEIWLSSTNVWHHKE